MNINTSNYQGLSSVSWGLNQDISSKNKDELISIQNEEQTLRVDFEERTYASEFGFRVNERGFFDKELNKMAKLPLDYEISIKSAYDISKELIKQDERLSFSNIDLAGVLNKYYNVLKATNEEFAKQDNLSLNRSEILNLTQGFSTESGEFNSTIIRVYPSADKLNEALEQNKFLNPLKLDNKVINFHFDEAINNTANNELIKPYLNTNAEVSKSGLLVNFIHKDLKESNDKVDFFIEPVSLNLISHQSFYNMLGNERAFEKYVRNENKEQMSFDLYLHVNGVDKKNTNNDKLSILYQQYLNYQKDLNIKEFANSSSIYELYINSLVNEFNELRNNVLQEDNTKLESINEARNKADLAFIEHRKRQANLDKVLKSYASVMM
ncbi:hypothetical protein DMB92_06395 [Campylobacter sp. MIT 99-7217]|uniref:hypothetical protein n=1 Tax=Campylobacter sp. MIT 99-7217 TaxID=535091 RepID=UPI0011590424|nr:hypothetical protein [Campylobacter sp. MIT 99-7217]TQR31316.1 hypothetical protein DMB92_06395 [Campylobacter sp. MIT 99-7217]